MTPSSVGLTIDQAYIVDTLSAYARIRTEVPLGYETLMEPDHPKLVEYVQNVIRPEFVRLGAYDLIETTGNNLVARFGSGRSPRTVLIQNYTVTQHNNLMKDPFSGKVGSASEWGVDGPVVFGQGVSQNKAHQVAMLAVAKALIETGTELAGTLYWAVNNEGRSSHGCSTSILQALDRTPDFGILQVGNKLRISLGNRGRVDVEVHVRGRAAHSSVPEEGSSAIDGANEVINRLKSLSWDNAHPILGKRHAIVYKVAYEPIAPHTLPSDAFLTIDRRLLPGDTPNDAADEIRHAIGDMDPYEVTVEAGVTMMPALVDPENVWVQALVAAHEGVIGTTPEFYHSKGSFDAAGPGEFGIPAVMYGASAGDGLLGTDFVAIEAVCQEAQVLADFIQRELT